jgi:hypothetical protein
LADFAGSVIALGQISEIKENFRLFLNICRIDCRVGSIKIGIHRSAALLTCGPCLRSHLTRNRDELAASSEAISEGSSLGFDGDAMAGGTRPSATSPRAQLFL